MLPGLPYPTYRLFVIAVGLAVAVGLYLLINKTRVGMLVRAGASNRQMVRALGVDIGRLYTAVFALGALLAGLAGIMTSPILAVQVGMGEEIILATFVVVVVGGVGSVKGAFVAGLVLGMMDTMLRAFLPGMLQGLMPGPEAQALGVGISSMGIYLMMAIVLLVAPAWPVCGGGLRMNARISACWPSLSCWRWCRLVAEALGQSLYDPAGRAGADPGHGGGQPEFHSWLWRDGQLWPCGVLSGLAAMSVGMLYHHHDAGTAFLGIIPGTTQMLITVPAAIVGVGSVRRCWLARCRCAPGACSSS